LARRKQTYRKSYAKPRRRSYARRFKRTFHKAKPSLLVSLGFGATQLSNLGDGSINAGGPIGGAITNIQAGNWQAAGQGLVRDELKLLMGYDINNGSLELPKGLMILIGTGLASKFAGRFVNNSIKRIPYVGRYLRL
jgi:hypothetical protein